MSPVIYFDSDDGAQALFISGRPVGELPFVLRPSESPAVFNQRENRRPAFYRAQRVVPANRQDKRNRTAAKIEKGGEPVCEEVPCFVVLPRESLGKRNTPEILRLSLGIRENDHGARAQYNRDARAEVSRKLRPARNGPSAVYFERNDRSLQNFNRDERRAREARPAIRSAA
jgi:hypothetical protein